MLQTALALKSSTSAVRAAYANCMWRTFSIDSLSTASPLTAPLLALVEKAHGNSTQLALVAEALAASRMLTNMAAKGACGDVSLDKFWSLITSQDKLVLTSEKFLAQAADESTCWTPQRNTITQVMLNYIHW